MAVYLIAFVIFIFYICCVPVKLAVILRVSSLPGFGAGAALFENRFALKKANRRMQKKKKPDAQRKKHTGPEKVAAWAALHRFLHHGLRSMKLEQIFLYGRIGTGDAASTALLCGCLNSLEAALGAVLSPEKINFRFDPDFSGGSDFDLGGMVSLTAGHIMLAALIGALEYGKRRFVIWKKNIRLKTLCAPRWKTSATW